VSQQQGDQHEELGHRSGHNAALIASAYCVRELILILGRCVSGYRRDEQRPAAPPPHVPIESASPLVVVDTPASLPCSPHISPSAGYFGTGDH
jgi:hypothetical protein